MEVQVNSNTYYNKPLSPKPASTLQKVGQQWLDDSGLGLIGHGIRYVVNYFSDSKGLDQNGAHVLASIRAQRN